MALIECPECGKQISDASSKCPSCGYKIPHPERAEVIKKCVIFVFAAIVIVMILVNMFMPKTRSPFEKFSPQMTKEDVHKKFGKSNLNDKECRFDTYNVSFVGLTGKLTVWYNDEEKIDGIWWQYSLEYYEDISDYSKQVDEIKEFFTKEYGEPSESYGKTIWEDSVGQEYIYELESGFDIFGPSITIKYRP